MVEIRWTAQAADDLEAATLYIARDSVHYASLFASDVMAAVERLEIFPASGRMIPELEDPSIRDIPLGDYRIVYRLNGDMVEILTIHHCSKLFTPSQLS